MFSPSPLHPASLTVSEPVQNAFHAENLQPVIMPTLLAQGVISPVPQRIIEAPTLAERANKALDALRRREVSGERLVWRISEA